MYSYRRVVLGASIVFRTPFLKCGFVFSKSKPTAAILSSPSSATNTLLKSQTSRKFTAQTHLLLQRISSPLSDNSSHLSDAMDLKEICSALEQFAPTSLAESWDNVGLLVEPTPPHQVRTMFLANDLTGEVLTEAIAKKADFILSYHPPIFVPLKKLTMGNAKERIIVRAIEERIAIYSPHTCYDAVAGGVNDWLAEGIGSCRVEPLKLSHQPSVSVDGSWTHKLEYLETVSCPVTFPLELSASGAVTGVTKTETSNGVHCTVTCNEEELVSFLRRIDDFPGVRSTVQITKLEKPPIPGAGVGRICKLDCPVSIATVVQRVKEHLKLQHVQLAVGNQKTQDSVVKSVATCAGSGASVLSGVVADMYLTGEMSHHDILAAVARGTSVLLCNHSNTERGYLGVLKMKLGKMFDGKVDVVVSETDADPLVVV